MRGPLVEIVTLGKRGEVVLPRRVRSALELHAGDELIVTVEEKRLVMERRSRGFGSYVEAISSTGSAAPPRESNATRARRGLGKFLSR